MGCAQIWQQVMENKQPRTFTFNRPVTMLFYGPLLILIAMFVYGLTVEFRLSLVVMLVFSLSLVGILVYLGILRRMRVEVEKAVWITPTKRYEMALGQVRSFGVVKFRSFRFIYISKHLADPFEDPSKPVVTDEDTFVLQYRPNAWEAISARINHLQPDLKPSSSARL